MIKQYNYSEIIKKEDQKRVIELVDNLIKKGDWCKTVPTFQTWSDLHLYEELKIFKNTFLQSCFSYLNYNNFQSNFDMKMWCFRDNRFNNSKKNQDTLWHTHEEFGKNKISGIYYLKNPRKEGTEFKNVEILVNPYTWYIYPSNLLHKPTKLKCFRNRYTIAADFYF